MSRGPRLQRRIRRHAWLGLLSLVALAAVALAVDGRRPVAQLSLATAYVGTAWLAVSLSLGPWRRLRRRPDPVHTDLRRDVAIWGGALALVHVVAGSQVHLRGQWWLYFVEPGADPGSLDLRTGMFGWANYTGLASALLVVVLLALSNDVCVRRLGARRWKGAQRWAVTMAALGVAHGVLYQVIETRAWLGVLALAALVVPSLVLRVRARG